ncbi:hypothetical protein [Clostridium sp. FP1]|uniref:hypothetical protein n=1 Tax=Clostridium sp. FP1 TaxID=2724076 RepID=UPI0013E96F51|nr:hypothetical protein [Clostridium sp. FP1]MBZ9633084.1 hypothetical protein [Clostridium sp. FP1]
MLTLIYNLILAIQSKLETVLNNVVSNFNRIGDLMTNVATANSNINSVKSDIASLTKSNVLNFETKVLTTPSSIRVDNEMDLLNISGRGILSECLIKAQNSDAVLRIYIDNILTWVGVANGGGATDFCGIAREATSASKSTVNLVGVVGICCSSNIYMIRPYPYIGSIITPSMNDLSIVRDGIAFNSNLRVTVARLASSVSSLDIYAGIEYHLAK